MPASLPPRKDPPARRMTRASTKEEHSAFQSNPTSVAPSQPSHSAQQQLINTGRVATHQPRQGLVGPRHAPSSGYRRYRTPVQMPTLTSAEPTHLNQAQISAQQHHVQPQHQTHHQQAQQPIMHQSFATQVLPSVSHASGSHQQQKPSPTDHASPNGAVSSAHIPGMTMGLSAAGMAPPSSNGVQYANTSYANSGFFDQFNMSSSIPLSMSGSNSAVGVVRDMERQGQSQNRQIHPRAAAQVLRKGLLQSQDTQYPDQTHQSHQLQNQQQSQPPTQQQQQMLQRSSNVQGHHQQDMPGHPASQQHMQPQLYQPIDAQQNAQHLVMNQNAQFVHQGQVGMHSQSGQLQQPSQMGSQEAHFDQHTYSMSHPGQLSNVGNMALQQAGEIQGRKSVNAATQTELLGWNGAPQGKGTAGGIAQQGAGDMAGAIAPGTLINPSGFAPSHIFDMGMGDMRQQGTQNSLALQHMQGQKVQYSQSGPVISNVRKATSQSADISPRKRRQTNARAAQTLPPTTAITSGRTFSCSGCGQDFAHKRDRDNHVRTIHERSFSCSKCTSRFKTKSDANRHVRIVHERVRPYPCPSCPSTFSERNKLRRHRETVHEKLRPFACPVCPARFGELGNLRQHTSSLHPEATIDNAQIRSRAAAAAAATVNQQIQS